MFGMSLRGRQLNVATYCVSVHRIYIALEPSLDGKEPTAFKAVVLSCCISSSISTNLLRICEILRITRISSGPTPSPSTDSGLVSHSVKIL